LHRGKFYRRCYIRGVRNDNARARLYYQPEPQSEQCRNYGKRDDPFKHVEAHSARARAVNIAQRRADCAHDQQNDRHLNKPYENIADKLKIARPRAD
jgi:hypothetical protein